MEKERTSMEAQLKNQLVDIAFSAAEKIVQDNFDNNKNRQLIDKFINEVGE